jgi:DNA processing protein
MGFDENTARIALTMIPGIGPVLSRRLVQYCGSAEMVFREKKKHLQSIEGIGNATLKLLGDKSCFKKAEKELKRMDKHGIRMLYFLDRDYPSRLKHCYDAPPLLYSLGNMNLNAARIVSIIGTRKISDYGIQLTEQLVQELVPYDVMIISGLAYGVDICAHRAAVENKIETVGVLAHGLDRIYPSTHTATAKKMMQHGGLLTDFPGDTNPDRENFPQRNRIVAGLSDAVVVVESGVKGGSMITAEYAFNYNRDVFAFPGRVGDPLSAGCNALIRSQKAGLIESAEDLAKAMGWEVKKPQSAQQIQLPALNDNEERIVCALRGMGNMHIDEISSVAEMPVFKISSLLLSLEFAGVVKSLPGKMYRLN